MVPRAILALVLLLTPGSASVVRGNAAARKALRPVGDLKAPADQGVVQPLNFKRDLIVCNAYPSDSPMTVKQNGESATGHDRVTYSNCEHMTSSVHTKDKLDFDFEGTGMQGTFEVGELPDSDATLLLVVEKRDAKTPLVAFQSFAFPSRVGGKDAQLAVIDTFKGNSSSPHLRMEDHIGSKEKRTVSKRAEQLNFNRIYAIEEGNYDASISDHAQVTNAGDAASLAQRVTGKRTLHLSKSQNYVVLRIGDDKHYPQSLVVFPPEMKSGSTMASRICLALFALVLTMQLV